MSINFTVLVYIVKGCNRTLTGIDNGGILQRLPQPLHQVDPTLSSKDSRTVDVMQGWLCLQSDATEAGAS